MKKETILKRAVIKYKLGLLQQIGHGSTRDVYIIDKEHVLKVARNDCYCDYNQREFEIYQNKCTEGIGDKYSASYCISDEGKYLLAERVIPCFGDNQSWTNVIDYSDKSKYEDELKAAGIFRLIDDSCIFNYGRKADGSYCVLDYSN